MAESGDSGKQKSGTYVRTGYPVDRFEHQVSGVDVVTGEWSEEPVSEGKLKELRKVAKANDVPLEETSKNPREEADS